MLIAGQALVKADWKRFSPTKAVNRKNPGWTQSRGHGEHHEEAARRVRHV
jgi:hypothetical protein